MLRSVVPILATPFTAEDRVDVAGLERIVAFAVSGGASAVATLGLASESFALSDDERATVVDAVRRAAGDGVHLVVGVASTSLRGAIEQADAAREAGADSLMVLPPFLAKASRQGLVDFFRRVGAVGGDIMVQDAPGTTGVELDQTLIAELAGLPGVTSFKIESTDSPVKMAAVRRLAPEALLFGGRNGIAMLDELAAGSTGTMPACEFTAELAAIHADISAGSAARDRYARLEPLLRMGVRPGKGWAVHKHVLHRLRVIGHTGVRFPAEPLQPDEIKELDSLLDDWIEEGDAHA